MGHYMTELAELESQIITQKRIYNLRLIAEKEYVHLVEGAAEAVLHAQFLSCSSCGQ